MAGDNQILRQWNLLRMLQTRGEGIPLADLASEAGVTERTIQRDFEMLAKFGFPIEFEEDEHGKRFWRMPYNFFSSGALVLSLTEAISLHFADKVLSPLGGTYLAEGIGTVLKKVRSLVPAKALDYFSALDEMIYVRRTGVSDYSEAGPIIRTVIDGCRESTTLRLRYRALWRGEEYVTKFDPFGLVLYDGDFFVVGYSHRSGARRILKAARILEATTLDEKFKRPESFHLEEQFRSSFGIFQADGKVAEITVRFMGVAAAYVEERIWHESQQLAWQPDEETLFDQPADDSALIATFHLAGVVEFKRWIKGFGDQAEILKPVWLRQELRDELRDALQRYDA